MQLGFSLLVIFAGTPTALGHGGMIKPESREIRTMGLDISSTFGWPISMRPGGDCLNNTPDKNLQTVPYGQSKIEMQANDGANHIGPCTVYLVNPSDVKDKLQVGRLDDCMRSLHPGPGNKGDDPIPAVMDIEVPESDLPCSPEHCVLEFYWEATHLEPHELFNNCADIKLNGNSSATTEDKDGGSIAKTPTATTTAPVATSTPSSSGTYISIGTDSSMKTAMDKWCNQNCNNDPTYCPESTCTAA